ncbi:MAG: mandelate racemase/muconate lactonizing enzyme family protein [Planctomycetota bacterium]|nr:mandelate racemase/muconate lactonizing enzyme family protein [Planctomycetaceae bacterium]MDQ3331392.1 mandelate racemase/muconate lactonizing enzyme family protein [Planctomycetota bacterium]
MSNPHDIRIAGAEVSFEPVPFRAPLKFGGRVVDRTQLINAVVTVERRDGSRTVGSGSMPVGNVWSWPSKVTSADEAERAMIAFSKKAAAAVIGAGYGHPIEIGVEQMASYEAIADAVRQELKLDETIPPLARLVAASALDAAIHDAYGRAHGRNSYRTLSKEFLAADLSTFLDVSFRGDHLDRFMLPKPKPRMPLYHLVGALDPLTDADVDKRIDDGLPETLSEWIAADALTHLKIKLSGDDRQWDIDRVLAVDAVASEAQAARGCETWWYSCDFNEKCESPEVVVAFLKAIRERNPHAFDRIQYLEQPLPRDLKVTPDQRVHAAAKLKPVVVDESLVNYEAFLAAKELGYTGVALKACKGHTESLLMAAAAEKNRMFLCVQDLTCPGQSFLHSASLAAWIPGVAAIEGNARQYCPAPNAEWAKRYPGLFDITDGTVTTGSLDGEGLGFAMS